VELTASDEVIPTEGVVQIPYPALTYLSKKLMLMIRLAAFLV